MRYPPLNNIPRRKTQISSFYGYEHLQRVRPGAFYDMQNLSADRFPLLHVRPDRKIWSRGLKTQGAPEALPVTPDSPVTAAETVNGTVTLCSETAVYYRGHSVPDALLMPDAANRRIIPFGRNFFIAPDGKYVITDENGVKETRHAAFSQALLGAALDYADGSGTAVQTGLVHTAPPASPAEGDLWTDTSDGTMLQKRYTNGAWETLGEIFVRITHAMADHYAVPGDRVRVSAGDIRDAAATVRGAENGVLLLTAPALVLLPADYIVSVRKTMPVLDLALEHDNRIWGCRFGPNENGEFVNEIYASALGDPTVWDRFDGISTDSFTVSLGCPGAFTGAAVVGGDPVFFKENHVIRVSGLTPQDYTLTVTPARGVKAGHRRTCVTLNEKIFYLSNAGVTVYDGALPYVISPEFGTHGFTDTAAFAWDGKYYLAAAENGVRRIYVYDTAAGLWHLEDDADNVRFFLLIGSAVFMLCRPDTSSLQYRFVVMNGPEAPPAGNLLGPEDPALACWYEDAPQKEWFAETGRLLTNNGTSVLRGAVFRVSLEPDAEFCASLRCGDGKWVQLCRARTQREEAFLLPVNTPRCQSFSLRLWGRGGCTVHSITLISEKTGEVKGLVR